MDCKSNFAYCLYLILDEQDMYVFTFSKKLIHKVVISSPSCIDKIFWQNILSKTHFIIFI